MATRYFIGLLLLALGVGLVFQELTGWHFGAFLSDWWPVIIVLYGLNLLVRQPSRPLLPLIIMAVGVLLQAGKLTLVPSNLWTIFWAALIALIGLWLLLPRRVRQTTVGVLVPSQSADRIEHSVLLGGIQIRNDSPHFRGGRVSTVLGGVDIDLRKAVLAPEGADLVLDAVLGGITVRVPEDWVAIVTSSAAVGGCENRTKKAGAAAPGPSVLRVRCSGVLGGVDIRN